MTISQQHLESRLWSAANALRGPVAHADFMTYMFPMLFWKWISDTWTWEHEQAVADFGDALNDEIEADYHRFDLPEGTHWNDVARSTLPNLGTRIQKALDKIAQANAEKLAGIFGDAAWGNKERLPEEHLRNLISSFDGLNLIPVIRYGASGHAALFFDNGIRMQDASLIDGHASKESRRAALQEEWDIWREFMDFGPLQ